MVWVVSMAALGFLRFRVAIVLAVAGGLAAACSSEVTQAIDIELVPDPSLNSDEQVAGALRTLALIVDSPEELYPAGTGRTSGNLRILNFIPTDPGLELVATIDVGDALPALRLERGGLPDVPLDLWFRGLPRAPKPNAPTAAEYRVRGVRFGEGTTELKVPFNLLPSYLPLRVNSVEPSEGSVLTDCSVEVIAVAMSKPVNVESLLVPGNVDLVPLGVREIKVPTAAELGAYEAMAGRLVQIYPNTVSGEGSTTLSYRLVISSAVTDAAGGPLDQLPGEQGAQPFVVEYLFDCPEVPTNQPAGGGGGCGSIRRCPTAGFACVEGLCLPTCSDQACESGSSCSPVTGLCETDCRLYAEAMICPDTRPTCDDETGTCR